MPRPPACAAFEERLAATAWGEGDAPGAAEAAAHAEGCAACATLLRRERRLVGMLRALPGAPGEPMAVPAIPEPCLAGASPCSTDRPQASRRGTGAGARRFRLPAAFVSLAAAVVVAAVVIRSQVMDTGHAPATCAAVVGELNIVDTAEFSAGPGDRLLAITGGPEAVAARLSASAR